jgi:hypothetical protein
MNSFPESIHVSNKGNFSQLFFQKQLYRLRKEVVNFLYKRGDKENDFIDLDTFNRAYVNDMSLTQQMTKIVMEELAVIGWNTYLGFGDTGLYIYSTEEKPDGVY